IIPTAFDWHLFIGDETALPAVARRPTQLAAGTRAVVLAQGDTPADEVAVETQTEASIPPTPRHGAEARSTHPLGQALEKPRLPAGDYYAWVACESLTAKALRAQLLADHGANRKWMRAAGYWRRGAVAVHDTFKEDE